MPVKVTAAAGSGRAYSDPTFGKSLVYSVPLVITGLTTAEIDADGVLKPGTPVRLMTGGRTLISGAAQAVEGVTVAPIKVAPSNAAADIAAAGTQDVAICAIGGVNRKVAEDNLGRVYSANELAAFAGAGCLLRLMQ